MPVYDDDSQELFQQKQYFMYSVLNEVLQSDMGKTMSGNSTNLGFTISMEGI